MATIYMIFPQEHHEFRQTALQQFHWAIERFSAMQERNPLAKSALGVLKVIHAKFINAINRALEMEASTGGSTASGGLRSLETPSSKQGHAISTVTGTSPSTSSSGSRGVLDDGTGQGGSLTTMSGGEEGVAQSSMAFTPGGMKAGGSVDNTNGWSMAPAMDLSSLQPMFPTYDLLFNDLNVVDDGTMAGFGDFPPPNLQQAEAQAQTQVQQMQGTTGHAQNDQYGNMPWQFGGDFGNDTVWKLLNEWEPGTVS